MDVSGIAQHPDSDVLMIQHALEIVRREISLLTEVSAAAARKEGIAVLLHMSQYQALSVKQCFTKIRKEIEKQRDLFGYLRCTVCLGSREFTLEQASISMRQALWFCRDRLCRVQSWRDAETERAAFDQRYCLEAALKKRVQVAAECLDEPRLTQELEETFHTLLSEINLNGQMVEDWFYQVLEACLYGMQQNGLAEEGFAENMAEKFWRCSDAQSVFQLLHQSVMQEMGRLKDQRALRETRPITAAKRYIQQHYREALRLEDVSNAVGFNATYFSTLFKKETGQNFMEYLTELRISKSKELLCGDKLSVQDVAEMVGYRDLKYFSRLFKNTTGVSPSDYKKLYK